MTVEIAQSIITNRLQELRKRSYDSLSKLVGETSCDRVNGPDGAEYQVETEARWDGHEGGNIRVIVAVDGPGISSLMPLTGDFLISASGSYIGEG
jgi:hypothetical protein